MSCAPDYVIDYVVSLMRPARQWCTLTLVTRWKQKGRIPMKSATRTTRPATMSEIAGQWQQAIRGDAGARDNLLRRIMPARGYDK